MEAGKHTGKAVSRVDGMAKVTGQARYAAEYGEEGILYGVIISATIARGVIERIDARAAEAVPGVVRMFTHENVPRLASLDLSYKDMVAPPGSPFRPLQGPRILFNHQPIAMVVAGTFEAARYAATLVNVTYKAEAPETSLPGNLNKAEHPKKKRIGFQKPVSRGHAQRALKESAAQVAGEYYHGPEHHNPMELHASTVLYGQDGALTIYDKTQGVLNSQHYVSMIFALPKSKVRVLSPYVGGAFGSGLRPQYQLYFAVLAALELKRSVKVSLTREQMFSFGHRPATLQQVSLGAVSNGYLQALTHYAVTETSQFEIYTENVVNWSGLLYQCDNVQLDHKVVALDLYTPLDMRAPGAATGVHALECAMDELAYKLDMDPLELRLQNYVQKDQYSGKPFSSKELLACYRQGAEKFGWAVRNPEPGSMKDGGKLVGWGMAGGVWDASQLPARARAVLDAQGKLVVSSATADIGTGTYTIMTQIAADVLGLPLEDVRFELGDSSFPLALVEGGSATAGSVGTAVLQACEKVKASLIHLVSKLHDSPLKGLGEDDMIIEEGVIRSIVEPLQHISIAAVMQRSRTKEIRKTSTSLPALLKQRKWARNTHSAVFAEVKIDPELGTITVSRVVSAVAAGRILNPKTARSQILGGVVWGISMALHEESILDPVAGRFMNHNLAEYHVPVQADIHQIDVIFVEEKDSIVNTLGVKGVGEIGLIGVAAAVANAIFHATGKRIRSLPIRLDAVL